MKTLIDYNEAAISLMLESFLAYELAIDFDERYSVNFKVTDRKDSFEIKINYLIQYYQPPYNDPQEAVDPIEVWKRHIKEVPKTSTLEQFADAILAVFLDISTQKFIDHK